MNDNEKNEPKKSLFNLSFNNEKMEQKLKQLANGINFIRHYFLKQFDC